jgi:hypothetical protein
MGDWRLNPGAGAMKHTTRRRPDITRVNATAQSLRLWVLEMIAWVAGLVGVKFRPDIRVEIGAAKRIVFLNAIHRCDERGRTFARRHWRNAPRGFRCQHTHGGIRAYLRVVKIRDLADLRCVLDNMEPAIRRVIRQLKKSSMHTHLVMRSVGAPADMLPFEAGTDEAVRAPDTS